MKKELTRKEFNMLVFLYKEQSRGYIFRCMGRKTDHFIWDIYPYVKYLDRDVINRLAYCGYLHYKDFRITDDGLKLLKEKGKR